MPLEHKLLLIVVIGLAAFAILWLVISRLRRSGGTCETLGDEADLDYPPRRVGKHPGLGMPYRQGLVMRFGEPHPLDKPWLDAERNVRDHPPQETFHPHPFPGPHERIPAISRSARFGKLVPEITLTRRQLEHINIQRRAAGKMPMNNLGFRSAIASQAAAATPLHSSSDWLVYLILYEILFDEHKSHLVAVDTGGITISPDLPFNGQGGSYGGAGATSSFEAPTPTPTDDEIGKVATRGLAYGSVGGLAAALAATESDPGPLHDGSLPPPGGAGYQGNDPQWGKQDDPPAAAPEPAQRDPEPQQEQAASEPEQSAPESSYSAPEPSGGGGND